MEYVPGEVYSREGFPDCFYLCCIDGSFLPGEEKHIRFVLITVGVALDQPRFCGEGMSDNSSHLKPTGVNLLPSLKMAGKLIQEREKK